MNLTEIPLTLQEIDGWILHREKQPYSAETLRLCNPTARDTCVDFDTARQICRQSGMGIGFVLSSEDDLICIDIDKCYINGALQSDVLALCNSTSTYIEKSPSGLGVHIWVKGKKPGTACRKGQIEIYDDKRYMTVTGDRISDSREILKDQDLINRAYALISSTEDVLSIENNPAIEVIVDTNCVVPDYALRRLELMPRFVSTWEKRRDSEFGSASEYDMSLANFGARAELSPQEIADLLVSWRLKHGIELKPHHQDYLGRTINKAIQGNRRRPLTDLGNVERFADRHGGDLIYVAELNTWFQWNGTRWQIFGEHYVHSLIKETVRVIPLEAEGVENAERARRIRRHAISSESNSRLNAIYSMSMKEPLFVVESDELDANLDLLGLKDGVYDLNEGSIAPADRDHLITHHANVSFDPHAACPRFTQFIDEVTQGDKELAAFLQRAVGYTLSGETSEQCFFFLHGAGCNGKSVLLDVLMQLLGDYACIAAPESFMKRLGTSGSGPREDIVRLKGKRLVVVNELGEDERFNEVFIKQVTGGDRVIGRIPHAKSSIEFQPQSKLWFAGNHQPYIYGVDTGIWRRIVLVPFTADFSNQRDPKLVHKLIGELPGILNWALEGYAEWQKNGLKPPQSVLAATSQYREDMDILSQFIEDECIPAADARVATPELFARYQMWCASNGITPMNNRTFGKKLSSKGYGKAKSNSTRYRTGLRLKEVPHKVAMFPLKTG